MSVAGFSKNQIKNILDWLLIIGLVVSIATPVTVNQISAASSVSPQAISNYLPLVQKNYPPQAPPGSVIIADHDSVGQFTQIPEEYILAASQLSMLFQHASVGGNIDNGLDDLMSMDPKYDRSNWNFEARGNPGWENKVTMFIERIQTLPSGETYDAAGFKFCYIDGYEGASVDDVFFNNNPNDGPGIEDLVALEKNHPDISFMYWTMPLTTDSTPDQVSYNQQMRNFILSNGKLLVDIADIESYRENGTQCTAAGLEALCPEYTSDGGHLNDLGSMRMAKALWWLMARMAGWDGLP